MSQTTEHAATVQAFLTKWEASGAAERANAQLFLAELCDLLGVERPLPKTPDEMEVNEGAPSRAPAEAQPWPKDLPAKPPRSALATLTAPAAVAEIATRFEGKAAKKGQEEIGRLLETLEALVRAVRLDDERWLIVRQKTNLHDTFEAYHEHFVLR